MLSVTNRFTSKNKSPVVAGWLLSDKWVQLFQIIIRFLCGKETAWQIYLTWSVISQFYYLSDLILSSDFLESVSWES